MKVLSVACPFLLGLLCLSSGAAAAASRDPKSLGAAAGGTAASLLQQQGAAAADAAAAAAQQRQALREKDDLPGPPQKKLRKTGSGQPGAAAAAAADEGPSAETREQYEKVLQELEDDPRYKEARERNDADAEARRRKINAWIKEREGKEPSSAAAEEREAERKKREKYGEVVDELGSNSKFLRAKERLGGGAGAGAPSSTKATKPHSFKR
ncbi:hypothetical protein, conserved [Eimeria brunetti]|uniref:Uncharacterized protein n=1 Tax=Eimeria brunetti TaxID=51314 RepID=U6LLT7_9EIME|nr:hypothetical protein, conserved [Eimeria brunetti]